MAQITATFSGGTDSSRYQGYLNYSEGTVDTANNRSYVYLNLYIGSNNASYSFFGYNNYGYIYIDGGQVATGNYTGTVNTNAKQICAWEGWIGHNNDGTKSITISYSISSGYAGSSSASTGWALTNIARYAAFSSITASSITDVGFTANFTVDATCDQYAISTDNGSTWGSWVVGDFTSKSVAVGGNLPSNTAINWKVKVRRKDSQLETVSGTQTATTLPQSNFAVWSII